MVPPLKRILLVEDDPDIQLVAHMALESIGGFAVLVCGSGKEAVDAAPRFAPDLMLLDVMMPEMDGPTTLQALRAIPALVAVPAAFLTAKVQPSDVARYRQLGISEIIPKPFDPMTLSETVRRLWERIHPGS
jgi:CheY-like chemotaxis protein